MNKPELLYDPLPIARIGVRKDDQVVLVANDFSCLSYMLEEYISLGITRILIPASFPESKALDQMPTILRKHTKVIDDLKEIETVSRLLYNIRKEFNVKMNEETNSVVFEKGTPKELVASIHSIHEDVRKLALGFNHNIQININPASSISSLRLIRSKSTNATSRIILAQIESILNQYEQIEFNALVPPKKETPFQLISLFDQLINDEKYIEYSNSIYQLQAPHSRDEAVIKLRTLSRSIGSKSYIKAGWNYVAKILKVWTGIPIPESDTISGLINQKALPPLVNLQASQQKAVEIWKKASLTTTPLGRDGLPVTEDNILWIPPLEGMKVGSNDNKAFNLGTVGELLRALRKAGFE